MSAVIWYSALFGLFMIIVVYNIFAKGLTEEPNLFNETIAYLEESDSVMGEKSTVTLQIFETVWTYFPLMMLLGVIWWAIVQAQKRPYD